jgi:HK97 family phage portal protein
MFSKLRSLFGGERKSDAWSALLDAGSATAAGIMVSPDRALKCVPAYASVRVVAETMGTLPIHLFERKSDGSKERATEHPLYKLLRDRPNGWTSADEFVMQLQMDALTHGLGLAFANRSGDRIVELIRLPAGSTVVETDPNTMEPRYKTTLKNGRTVTYPWRDVLHVPTLGGLAPIKQASEAIGLAMAMDSHAANLFGRGARPSGVLKTAKKVPEDVGKRLKASWQSAHSGGGSGGTAILEDGMEFEALTFNSVDMQFQQLRAFQVTEIARALRVPPTLLQDFGRATWGNATEMSQNFLTFTVMPWTKLWQGAISRLLTVEEQAKFFPEFLVDDLVKADIAARFTAYAQAVQSRIILPNEIRAMENRAPIAGGDEFPPASNIPNDPARQQQQRPKP